MIPRLPVLFIGHGSPMNAIEENEFTRALQALGQRLPRPRAILCISAHWMSEGTWITHMNHPRTIHDFHGFPPALFEVRFPAPGEPKLAEEIVAQIANPKIQLDNEMWGFDHGSWSVLRHMYPNADVPVLQLSLDINQPAQYHFQLGRSLRPLRDQGILIVGSGNIVHNLRQIQWGQDTKPFAWAIEFDEWVKQNLEKRDFTALLSKATSFAAGQLSIPTPDHWYPLLYTLGASESADKLEFIYEGIQNASISMRSLSFASSI